MKNPELAYRDWLAAEHPECLDVFDQLLASFETRIILQDQKKIMTKRIVCELKVEFTPLPADKVYAYNEALRTLWKGLACKQGELDPAQAGPLVGMSPPPQFEALLEADLTIPPDISFLQSQPDATRLAQNTTGDTG